MLLSQVELAPLAGAIGLNLLYKNEQLLPPQLLKKKLTLPF